MKLDRSPLETRIEEVRDALSTVNDPELDEPGTELGFIHEVSVDLRGGRVGKLSSSHLLVLG
jgi:metal-sulfur cluster biosynthetic enzyme